MAGAAGRVRGRVLGRFPLALPVGDVSISEDRNETFFPPRLGIFFAPTLGRRADIIIIANIY